MGPLTRRDFLSGATALGVTGWPAGEATPVPINPRSTWAVDRPPKGPLAEEEVKFLIVHHSASRNGHIGAEVPAILRGYYDFHTGTRGWNDIAYNFLIDAGGGIWEGRAGSLEGPVAGDATGGNQGFSQLVCVIGDYDKADPSPASLTSLVWLTAWLADRYAVSTEPEATVTFVSRGSNRWPAGVEVTTPTITGHRSMSRTSCPGANLWTYVAGELTADVEALRSSSTTPASVSSTTSLPPTTTTTIPNPQTTAAPPTSPPVAAPSPTPPSARGAVPSILWVGMGVLTGLVAGLLRWRRRRMG